MTKKEAIKYLEELVKEITVRLEGIQKWKNGSVIIMAIHKAIKALKKPEIIRCKDCYYFIPPKDRDYHCYSCRETWSDHTIVYENDFCSKAIRKVDVCMRRKKNGEHK